jgi:hypothetical protein
VEVPEPPLERTAAFVSRLVPPLAARTPDEIVEPVEPPLAAGAGTVAAGDDGTGTGIAGSAGAWTVGTGTGSEGTCGTGTGVATVGSGSCAA